jgi:hypothetical protein
VLLVPALLAALALAMAVALPELAVDAVRALRATKGPEFLSAERRQVQMDAFDD